MARRVVIALVVAGIVTAQAAAAGTRPNFGAAPVTTKKLGARSYFSFDLQPGASAQDSIVVSNASQQRQTLKLGTSIGTTAQGSGDAYVGAFQPCRGAACWIYGLPATVTLAPDTQRTIPFTVVVPATAPRRQYLAGITVEPAKRPGPTSLGSHGGVGAQAVIIHQVNIGVALTVGSTASLVRRLEVTNVRATAIGGTGKLLIRERNTGEAFLHATGSAECIGGAFHRVYPVTSDTVLPGDSTVLAVNAAGLAPGKSLRCTVQLDYGGGSAAPAAWRGAVRLAADRPAKVVQTGPHSYAQVPKAGIPKWAIALIAAGSLVVLALLVVIVVLIRRRPSPAT